VNYENEFTIWPNKSISITFPNQDFFYITDEPIYIFNGIEHNWPAHKGIRFKLKDAESWHNLSDCFSSIYYKNKGDKEIWFTKKHTLGKSSL